MFLLTVKVILMFLTACLPAHLKANPSKAPTILTPTTELTPDSAQPRLINTATANNLKSVTSRSNSRQNKNRQDSEVKEIQHENPEHVYGLNSGLKRFDQNINARYWIIFHDPATLQKKQEFEQKARLNVAAKGNTVQTPKAIEQNRLKLMQNYNRSLLQQQRQFEYYLSSVAGNANVTKRFQNTVNGIVVNNLNADNIAKLKKDPRIKSILPDGRVDATLNKGLDLIKAQQVWQGINGVNATGKDITVAILDTGVDYLHPDLGGCLGEGCKVIGGYDFINDDADPIDINGHGTHVAGTVAANGPVYKGVAPDASILAVKVLNDNGSGYFSEIVTGVEYALNPDGDPLTDDAVDIINMSLSGGKWGDDDPLILATNNAVEAGVTIVVAAGNSGNYGDIQGFSPAASAHAITVGSVTKELELSWFSSKGPALSHAGLKPEVLAPGSDIEAPWPGGGYKQISGTSMASPHVAGAAALLLEAMPDLSPAAIKQRLMASAMDLELDPYAQGAGVIDIASAIESDLGVSEGGIDFGIITDEISGEKNLQGTLTLNNLSDNVLSGKISIIETENLPPGLTFTLDGDSFSIAEKDTLSLKVNVQISDITALPFAENESGLHFAKLLFESDTVTLKVPVMLSKALLLTLQNTGKDAALVEIFNEKGRVFWNYIYSGDREQITVTEASRLHTYAYYENPSADVPAMQNLPLIPNSYSQVMGYEAFSLDLNTSLTIDYSDANLEKIIGPNQVIGLDSTSVNEAALTSVAETVEMSIIHVEIDKNRAYEWGYKTIPQSNTRSYLALGRMTPDFNNYVTWVNRPAGSGNANTLSDTNIDALFDANIMISWYELSQNEGSLFDLDFSTSNVIEFTGTESFANSQNLTTTPTTTDIDDIESNEPLTDPLPELGLEIIWATPYVDSRSYGATRLSLNDNTRIHLSTDSLADFAILPTIVPKQDVPFYNPIVAQLPRLGLLLQSGSEQGDSKQNNTQQNNTEPDSVINHPYTVIDDTRNFDLSLGFSYVNAIRFSDPNAYINRGDNFVNIQGVRLGAAAVAPEFTSACQDGSIHSGTYDLRWSRLPNNEHGCPDFNLSFNMTTHGRLENQNSIEFEPGQSEEYLPGITMQFIQDGETSPDFATYPDQSMLKLTLSGSYLEHSYVTDWVEMQIDNVAVRINQQDWTTTDWYFDTNAWTLELPSVEEDSFVDVRIEYSSGASKLARQTINRAFKLLAGQPLDNDPEDSTPDLTDSDTDGMTDQWELANGLDPNNADDAMSDYDNDGLVAIDEMIFGSSPLNADSDGDGIFDGAEVLRGSDLLDVLSIPQKIAIIRDFDGDGVSDYVYYDAVNKQAKIETASGIMTVDIPNENDELLIPVSGDFDGDSIADLTFHKPLMQQFLSYYSSDNQWHTTLMGTHSELQASIADYDGDGISDYAVFDATNNEWLIIMSSTNEKVTKQVADQKPEEQ